MERGEGLVTTRPVELRSYGVGGCDMAALLRRPQPLSGEQTFARLASSVVRQLKRTRGIVGEDQLGGAKVTLTFGDEPSSELVAGRDLIELASVEKPSYLIPAHPPSHRPASARTTSSVSASFTELRPTTSIGRSFTVVTKASPVAHSSGVRTVTCTGSPRTDSARSAAA